MKANRTITRVLGTAIAVAALMVTSILPASAHVGVKADTYAAGSTAMVTFGFSHGCEESPTTALVFQIPEEFNSVAPVFAPGWSIEIEKETLATPVAGSNGEEITERTSVVTYTADKPMEDGIYAMVTLRLPLPEDAAGTDIAFPIIQECEEGENAWIEVAKDGEDADDLESPAPVITVTEPDADNGH